MMNARASLAMGQRLAVAKLVQDGLDYLVAPSMPDAGSQYVESPVRFRQFTTKQPVADEAIAVWVPITDFRPHRNPPILRRVIEHRGLDMARRRRGEPIAFPNVVVAHHIMTVGQLEELDYLVRDFEDALFQSPVELGGVPVDWWYGHSQEETSANYEPNQEPLRFRSVDLLSDPIRTAHFSNQVERFKDLNTEFERGWNFLLAICKSPPVEGIEEHYDIDPHRVAEMLLAGQGDP